ncbi:MAG: Ig-like domain-containing protein [Eubacteriales bacterium]|nr:Ig-like domain-containing protein [Eubacteriales bacterium]
MTLRHKKTQQGGRWRWRGVLGIVLGAALLLGGAFSAWAAVRCGRCQVLPVEISTAAQLTHLGHVARQESCTCGIDGWQADGCYLLTADIDLTGETAWQSIGNAEHPFAGHLNGGGKTIAMNDTSAAAAQTGLFGTLDGACIENLTITGSMAANALPEGACVGVLAACARDSEITGCYVEAQLSCQGGEPYQAGGLLGQAQDTQLASCVFLGTVQAAGDDAVSGGICGSLTASPQKSASMKNCLSTGAVSGGALLGRLSGEPVLEGNLFGAGLCGTEQGVQALAENPAGILGVAVKPLAFLPNEEEKKAVITFGSDALPAGIGLVSSQPAVLFADGTWLSGVPGASETLDIDYTLEMTTGLTLPGGGARVVTLARGKADVYAAVPPTAGVELWADGAAVPTAEERTVTIGQAQVLLTAQVSGVPKGDIQWVCSLEEASRDAAMTWREDGYGRLHLTFDQKLASPVRAQVYACWEEGTSVRSPVLTLVITPVYVTDIALSAPPSAILYAGGAGVAATVTVNPAQATVGGHEWLADGQATTQVVQKGNKLFAADTLVAPWMQAELTVRTLGKTAQGTQAVSAQSIQAIVRRPVSDVVVTAAPQGTLLVGQVYALQAQAAAAGGAQPYETAVQWSSSNPAVAQIDPATGEVTVKEAGNVTFTAQSLGFSADGATYVRTQADYVCQQPCTCSVEVTAFNAQLLAMSYSQKKLTVQLETAVSGSTTCKQAGHDRGQPQITGYSLSEENTAGASLEGDALSVTRPGTAEVLVHVRYHDKDFEQSVICTVVQRGKQQVLTHAATGISAQGSLPKAELSVQVARDKDRTALALAAKADPQGTLLRYYDIALLRDGQPLEWSGKMTVRIPIPVGMEDYQARIFRVDGDTAALTEIKPVSMDKGCWVFDTTAMGKYLVTGRIVTHPVTVTCGSHGSVSPAGIVQAVEARDLEIRIYADEGYRIDTVQVDGEPLEQPVSRYVFANVMEEHSIHATFAPDDRFVSTVLVSASAIGPGSIYPSGSVPVLAGQDQSFGLLAGAGNALQYLLIDGQRVEAKDATFTLEQVTAAHEIVAVFGEPQEAAQEVGFHWPWWVWTLAAACLLALAGVAVWALRRNGEAE